MQRTQGWATPQSWRYRKKPKDGPPVNTKTQTGVLTWNANGTLGQMQITDQINAANSQTCAYSHDDLARITGANCGAVWSQTFNFDPFGNLSKSGSATFQPVYTGATGTGTSPTNQYYSLPDGASGTSNYYDANGNLKYDVTHNPYTWDADGNMLSIDGSAVTMIYDALDRMVEQTRGSIHTEIAYGPYGLKLALMNGQTLVNAFVKLPGGARAVYSNSGLAYYRHSDHLGNSRLATKLDRTKYYDVAYAPYGEDYNGSGTQDLAFTDENQDTVTGGVSSWTANLYDFMFREYRTGHGRWTSPDPAGLGAVDPTNPQSWNRYAYVVNNPLAFIDPLGLCHRQYESVTSTVNGVSTTSYMSVFVDDPGSTCIFISGGNPCGQAMGYDIGPEGSAVCHPPGTTISISAGSCPSWANCPMGAGLAPQADGAANAAKDAVKNFMKSTKPDPPLRGAPSKTPEPLKLSPLRQMLKDVVDEAAAALAGVANGSKMISVPVGAPDVQKAFHDPASPLCACST